ncbi:hypothetical protein THRCLA_22153 [Thraustotheca clavata]|uniref:Mitochondrial protein n=1 Tax=Thraustotheca clavata TaxID=74557 RepID=A0A1V9ZBR4_9STRA|nr:hypothetical protein THRCLA_22153 [Thraustotheca clavata]
MSRSKLLEAFKFTLYVAIPIGVTYVYMQPQIVNAVVKELDYINYPAQQLTREEIMEKMKKGSDERKSRQ